MSPFYCCSWFSAETLMQLPSYISAVMITQLVKGLNDNKMLPVHLARRTAAWEENLGGDCLSNRLLLLIDCYGKRVD